VSRSDLGKDAISDREVRAGIQQAKNGAVELNIITLEALAVGIAGGGIGHSWGLGAAGFICVGLLAHLGARYARAATVIATINGDGVSRGRFHCPNTGGCLRWRARGHRPTIRAGILIEPFL
jgi:hypothetical protein